MTQKAVINADVLRWAIERAGLNADDLAQGITSKHENVLAWESGAALPTLNQARKLAERLRVPFGYLFLHEPPHEELPIPDLRTRYDEPLRAPSPDLMDQIRLAIQRQEWFRDYSIRHGAEPLPFVGSVASGEDVGDVAATIRNDLSLGEFQFRAGSWDGFLTEFVRASERVGVLVMRSGVVGNNSRRPLDVAEFQGFCIVDPYAPVVFLNSKDFVSARIFTMAHELAHLWAGQSGVTLTDPATTPLSENQLERWCNAVAAETLVPTDEFMVRWDSQTEVGELIDSLTRAFRVSSLVVLRRALGLGTISQDLFYSRLEIEREKQVVRQASGSSGNQINNVIARSSRRFTEALVAATLEGSAGYAEASRLLGVKVKTLRSLAVDIGIL